MQHEDPTMIQDVRQVHLDEHARRDAMAGPPDIRPLLQARLREAVYDAVVHRWPEMQRAERMAKIDEIVADLNEITRKHLERNKDAQGVVGADDGDAGDSGDAVADAGAAG